MDSGNEPEVMPRRYTVKEIDALRSACSLRWLYGTTHIPNGGWSRQYQGSEKDKGTEELVRTYMIAGLTADDIYRADAPKEAK